MKPSWKPSAKRASDVTMYPELAHYETGNLSLTIHEAVPDKYYGVVRGDFVSAVHTSETREGIMAMLDAFKAKYPAETAA